MSASPPPIAGPQPDDLARVAGGAELLRCRSGAARGGGQDSPRLRERHDAVRALGERPRPGAHGGRHARPAPVRRRSLRAGPGALHCGAQAGGDARPVPVPDRDREPRRESGGAAQLAQASPASAARPEGRRGGRPAGPDSRHHAARAARPGPVRARLRVRIARRGAGDARARVGRFRLGDGARRGQGGQDAAHARRRALAARARALPGPRPPRAGRSASRARCFCRSPGAGWAPPTCAGGCGRGRGWPRPGCRCWATPIHTRFATRSRHTCWRAERTSGRSRSCSDTPAFRRRRSTLG